MNYPILPVLLLSPILSAQAPDPFSSIDDAVEAVLAEQPIPGVVVMLQRSDRVLLRRAYGVADVESGEPMTPEHLFQVGSITKTFTATLLGVAVDRGWVESTDPVSRFLPPEVDLPEPVARITLAQLATHTSGLPREPVNRVNLPDTPSVMAPYSVAQLYEGLAATELVRPAGEAWSYSNLGYALLGHCLERAAEKPYADLLRDEVAKPLGLRATGVHFTDEQERQLATCYWPEDAEPIGRDRWRFGEVVGFAGVFSCGDDLLALLASHSAPDGGPLLSAATREGLHRPVVEIGQGRRMAAGWFVDEIPGMGSLLGHGGEVDGHSGCVALVPSAGIGIVVLCNRGGKSAESVIRAVMAQLPALMRPR